MGMEKNEAADYDEMDYGDEFNDSEEKRYRKETYGDSKKDNDAADEAEEGEEDQSESSSFDPPEVVPLAKDFSRRANRGNRMSALVGKALDEDDDFWGGVGKDFFGGGLDDENDAKEGEDASEEKSFCEDDALEGSAGLDSFDSDFGREEEEEAAAA